MEYKDYYSILGVSKSADEKEIKRAYRKLARTHHPDVNPGDPGAEQRFKEINEAYTVLSDAEKRKMYDRFGAEWENYQRAGVGPDDMPFGTAGTGPRGERVYTRNISPEEFEAIFGGGLGGFGRAQGAEGTGEFSDFFEALFGGGRTARTRTAARPRQGQDVETDITVSLEEAFHGTSRTIQWETGQRIEVKVPRGVHTGSRVRVSGKGQPGMGGGPTGDLYLNVTVSPHPMFTRQGNDLRVQVPVPLYDAILGGEVQVPTMERPVVLTVPAGTQNGRTFRLRGLGMPNLRHPEQRGDLYAEVSIRLPTEITPEQRRLFEQLRSLEEPGR